MDKDEGGWVLGRMHGAGDEAANYISSVNVLALMFDVGRGMQTACLLGVALIVGISEHVSYRCFAQMADVFMLEVNRSKKLVQPDQTVMLLGA